MTGYGKLYVAGGQHCVNDKPSHTFTFAIMTSALQLFTCSVLGDCGPCDCELRPETLKTVLIWLPLSLTRLQEHQDNKFDLL